MISLKMGNTIDLLSAALPLIGLRQL